MKQLFSFRFFLGIGLIIFFSHQILCSERADRELLFPMLPPQNSHIEPLQILAAVLENDSEWNDHNGLSHDCLYTMSRKSIFIYSVVIFIGLLGILVSDSECHSPQCYSWASGISGSVAMLGGARFSLQLLRAHKSRAIVNFVNRVKNLTTLASSPSPQNEEDNTV